MVVGAACAARQICYRTRINQCGWPPTVLNAEDILHLPKVPVDAMMTLGPHPPTVKRQTSFDYSSDSQLCYS
ncbi:hypothetical protein ACTXT7_002508 [Hymenolepis weldensis]